jgi:hypothetical protein
MKTLRWLCVLALGFAAGRSWAQDVASGPEKGKDVPALNVFDATGPNMDKDVDYVAKRKGKPTIYVFVQADKWDRPMAKFLKGLDNAVPKASKDATVVAVWVTKDAAKSKQYLPVAQQALKFEATALTCFTGGDTGPNRWGINADAHVTVVVAVKGKAAALFGYMSVNETEAPAVIAAMKKALTDK